VQRIRRGFAVDDRSLALDTILEVPHGGNFLEAGHTLEHFRNELWVPQLHDRTGFEHWREQGASDMTERASERVRELLADARHQVVGTPHADAVNHVTREIFRREGFSCELSERILSC
jgi:trimethylamine--corrinoid protein Co-methyltransferase